MKFKLARGFTLVELLIVIGLLGAIALIVIAAINPIEQANRARDARFRADGSQLISAIERYYTAHSKFPWEDCGGGSCPDSEDAFGFVSASDSTAGLCADASCSTGGVLITNDELKTEFLSRDWVEATGIDKQIWLGKGQGSSSSVYACFVPLSKASKDKAITDGTVRTGSFTAGGIPADGSCTAADDVWVGSAITSTCLVCVPE